MTPATAQDWAVSGFFSQRVEADTNTFGETGDDGALNSFTDLGIVIRNRGPRGGFSFAPGISFTLTTDDEIDSSNINPRFNLAGDYALSRRLSVNANASLVPRLTNFSSVTEDEDLGPIIDPQFETGTALELVGRASAGFSYALTPRDDLSGNVSYTTRRYPDGSGGDNFTETQSYGANVSWSRPLSELTSVSLNGGYRRFEALDGDGNTSDSFDLGVGINQRLSPRFAYNVNIGGVYTVSDQPGTTGDDSSLNFNGGLSLRYTGAGFASSLGVNTGVDQDRDGQIQSRTSVFGNVSTPLTADTNVSLASTLATSTPLLDEDTGDDGLNFSIGPNLNHRLNEDWSISTGYRLRTDLEDTTGDDGVSHLFFLQISRNLQLL